MKHDVILRSFLSRISLRCNTVGLQTVEDALVFLYSCADLFPGLIDFMELVEIVLECRQCLLIHFAQADYWLVGVCSVEQLGLVQAYEILLLVIDVEVSTKSCVLHPCYDFLHLRGKRSTLSTCETCIWICNRLPLQSVLHDRILSLVVLRKIKRKTKTLRHISVSEATILLHNRKLGVLT